MELTLVMGLLLTEYDGSSGQASKRSREVLSVKEKEGSIWVQWSARITAGVVVEGETGSVGSGCQQSLAVSEAGYYRHGGYG